MSVEAVVVAMGGGVVERLRMLSAVRVSQSVTHPTCFGTSLLPLRSRAARRPWAASL